MADIAFEPEVAIDFQPIDFEPEAAPQPAPDPYNVVGRTLQGALESTKDVPVEAAFEPFPAAKRAIEAIAPKFEEGSIPAAITDELKAAAGAILSPGGVALGAAGLAAPLVAAPIAGVLASPSMVSGIKQAATAETSAEMAGGITRAALGGAAVAGGVLPGLKAIRSRAPAAAEAAMATADSLKTTAEKPVVEAPKPVEEIKPAIEPTKSVESAPAPIATTETGQQILTAEKAKDILPYSDYWTSPQYLFRDIPDALEQVNRTINAELDYKSLTSHANEGLSALQKSLTPEDQVKLTTAFKTKQANPTSDVVEQLPPNLQKAHAHIRNIYDTLRARIQARKEEALFDSLSGPQANALRQVVDGIPKEQAYKENGLREGGRAIVDSAFDEWQAIQKWGIEEYTTMMEKGSYRVVAPDGTTVAIGETRAAAAKKAADWLKDNPNVKTVTIDDEFAPGVEFPTKLSRGQYFRMIQRLSDNLDASAKEVQEIIRKHGSIVAVKPTDKYAAPMNARRGILKGEENIFDILPYYVHAMEKKLALDPVIKQARNEVIPNLPKYAGQAMERLMTDVKGAKSPVDEYVDAVLAPLGTRPYAYSRGVNIARNVAAHLTLGYRPVSALVNLASGVMHPWVKTSTKYLADGAAWLRTPEGKAALDANKSHLGIEAAFIHETLRPKAEEPMYKPLGMFQAAERINRPLSFGTYYQYAIKELGIAHDAAIKFAVEATQTTQFLYNTASLPKLLRGPTGRLLGQFKTYMVKESEFIRGLRGSEIPKYLTAFLVTGGPRALIYTLKSLPLLGGAALLLNLEDWLNQNAPATSRGIGGAAGVDVSPSVAFQFPQKAEEWAGPVVGDILKLWNNVVGPAIKGENRDIRDVGEWAARLAPSAYYWSSLVEAAMSKEGWITDSRGRIIYKPSKSDYVKYALGAKPLQQSIEEVERRFLQETATIQRKNNTRLVDDFLDAIEKQDGAKAQRLAKDLGEAGISYQSILQAAKNRKIEPRLRNFKSLPKGMQAQEIERLQPKE